MIEQPPLLSIRRNFTRPSPAQIAALTDTQTGHVVDALEGRASLSHRIKPVSSAVRFCGAALTCHTGPGDFLATSAALEVAQPGDVLVFATDA
jgi:4-hydroxy-4-methyl-2-oxoglutarate aldolase